MPPRGRKRAILRGLLAGLGALAISVPGLACGGGDDDGDGGGSAGGYGSGAAATTEEAATEETTTSDDQAAASGGMTVDAADFVFEPNTVTVSTGDTVTWENTGETTHNVEGKGFFSDGMEPGDAFEHEFTEAGVYDYLCTLHPDSMTGTVVVE